MRWRHDTIVQHSARPPARPPARARARACARARASAHVGLERPAACGGGGGAGRWPGGATALGGPDWPMAATDGGGGRRAVPKRTAGMAAACTNACMNACTRAQDLSEDNGVRPAKERQWAVGCRETTSICRPAPPRRPISDCLRCSDTKHTLRGFQPPEAPEKRTRRRARLAVLELSAMSAMGLNSSVTISINCRTCAEDVGGHNSLRIADFER